MPPPNYKSLSVPIRVYERVQAVQAELRREGYGAIPPELHPHDKEGGISIGFVLDAALNALAHTKREYMKGKK